MFFRFSLSFSRFSISLLYEMSYMTLSSQEKTKYWGGRMHGPSPPPQIFLGGPSPQSPLDFRPCQRPPSAIPRRPCIRVEINLRATKGGGVPPPPPPRFSFCATFS